jgi:hypothetical protein
MGVRPAALWLGNFIFDAACLLATAAGLFVLCLIFKQTFLLRANLFPAILMFVAYTLQSAMFVYILSFAFEKATTAQVISNYVWLLVYTVCALRLFLISHPSCPPFLSHMLCLLCSRF